MPTERNLLVNEIVTRGASEAGEQLRRVGDDVESSGRRALYSGRRWEHATGMMQRGFQGLAGLVGISGAAFGVKDLAEAGMHLQQQQTQLRDALKAVGVTGSAAFDRINGAAVKSAENGGFSRDEELQSLTQFVTATHSSTEALKANQAAVNLARREGISYTSAQHYMAQAVVGNVNRLKQYIGYIKPVETAEQNLAQSHKANVDAWQLQAEAMNKASSGSGTDWLRQMELQHGITRQMEQQAEEQDKLATGREVINRLTNGTTFKGAQQQYDKTLQGQITDLKQTFEEVTGAIGMKLLPFMTDVVRGALRFVQVMDTVKPVAIGVAAAITALGAMAFGRMLFGGLVYALTPLRKMYKAFTLVNDATKETQVQSAITTAKLYVMSAASYVSAAADWVAATATTAWGVATDFLTMSLTALEIPLWVVIAGVAALAAIVYLVIRYHKQLGDAAVAAWHWIEGAEQAAWHGIESRWTTIFHVVAAPFEDAAKVVVSGWRSVEHWADSTWDSIKNGVTGVVRWVLREFQRMWQGVQHVWHDITSLGGILGGGGSGGGVSGALHSATFGLLNQGGEVRAHGDTATRVKHLYTGGPAGTDTVEGWLTPGEEVLTRAGAATLGGMVGQAGMTLLNAGGNPFQGAGTNPLDGMQIAASPVYVQVDSKTIARAVVEYTLKRAARGPSSLSGGGLVTGSH